MAFAKDGIVGQGIDLGKSVLALSALSIFAKLLKIDLSQLSILGISIGSNSTKLIPGFLGLALMYAYIAFIVARAEAAVEQQINKESVAARKAVVESKSLMTLVILMLPLSVIVYSLPYIFGGFAIVLLWADSVSVVKLVWALATQ